MSVAQEIRIYLEGIGSALKTRRFRVPAYQRSYAWEREHVQALIDDITDAINNKEAEYFLGSIVVTGNALQAFEVVDGQQRLATISLIIAAIKDYFLREGDTQVVASVNSEFLANVDRKTKERQPKLVMNEVDNEAYQDLLESITEVSEERYYRHSNRRLIEAARAAYDHVVWLCGKSKDWENDLHSLLDYIESNLKTIMVVAPDDSNAFVIFETLNDRGLDLAISDLLKNYLFHRSGDKIEEAKNRWLSMVAILEGASDDPLIVTYLRHFAMSRYGLVREKELFGVIKRKIGNKKAALQFSSELCSTARTYTALINTDHEFWSNFDGKVRESVRAFNLLGMVQVRPLLLAILQKFDEHLVNKTFSKLVAVAVRFQIVGGVGGGTLEKFYSETARGVSEGKLQSTADVIKAFTTLPVDSVFKQAFSVATITKQALARFYLRALEEQVSKDPEKEPSKEPSRVNLEHVLPLTPGTAWLKSWTPDEARAYQRRLGNLAIMASKPNTSIGNDAFVEKKKVYSSSGFITTRWIAEHEQWNKKSIEERQLRLAEFAVKLWSIKI